MAVKRKIIVQLDFDGKGAKKGADETEEAIKKVKKSSNGLSAQIAKIGPQLAAAFTVGAIVNFAKVSIEKFRQFEKAVASLSAITGQTGDSLKFLENEALRLAKSSGIAAQDVAKAFELMGSAKPELLANGEALAGVTEQAILLAQASGLELPVAIDSLANTLNQFGLGAESAKSVVDQLAASSKEGASAVPELAQALKVAGTTANASKVPLNESLAAIELFAEAGVKGSEAGTEFRNFLLKAQQAGIGFENGVFKMSKAITDLEKKQLSVTKANKIFGEGATRIALSLANGRKRFEALSGAITKQGVASEQAEKNTATLDFALQRLSATFEAEIIEEVSKGGNVMTDFINILTKVIERSDELIKPFKEVAEFTGLLGDLFGFLAEKVGISVGEFDVLGTVFEVVGASIRFSLLGPLEAVRFALAELGVFDEKSFENPLNAFREFEFEIKKIQEATGASQQDLLDFAQAGGVTYEEFQKLQTALRSGRLSVEEQEKALNKVIVLYNDWKASTSDAAKAQKDLGDAVGDGKPGTVTGSIADLENKIKELTKRIKTELVPGTEEYTNALEQLTTATFNLQRATGQIEPIPIDSIDAVDTLVDKTKELPMRTKDAVMEYAANLKAASGEAREGIELDWEAIRDTSITAAGDLASIFIASQDKQLAALEGRKEAELAAAEGNAEKQAAIEEKYAKQALQLKAKESRRQILIDSFVAVLKSLATLGWPQGLAAAIPIGIQTAVALAGVEANKGFFEGGYTGDADPRSIAGAVHGREFVFTAGKTRKLRPAFEMIHKGKIPESAVAQFAEAVRTGNSFTWNSSNTLDDRGIVGEIRALRSDLRRGRKGTRYNTKRRF